MEANKNDNISGEREEIKTENPADTQNDDNHLSEVIKSVERLRFTSRSWKEDKKLVILDVDNKFLYDTKGKRPRHYLHEFLTLVSKLYNIVIWFSGSMTTLTQEMKTLRITDNPNYEISLFLDKKSSSDTSESEEGPNFSKNPHLIWEKYPSHSPKNTIILLADEDYRKKDGVDDKLRKLSEYLLFISDVTDFRSLDHSQWREYLKVQMKKQVHDYLSRVKELVSAYEIEELNSLRPGKKLLVLDIDRTIFALEKTEPMRRPHLDEFLTRAYKNYDIVIWSARSMNAIDIVLNWMRIKKNPDYKIAFQLDREAMVSIPLMTKLEAKIKPLHLIWGKYRQFSAKNTIILDDQQINFFMNPQSGLLVKPYVAEEANSSEDTELLKLAEYLETIADDEDIQCSNHQIWEEYISY